MVGAPNKSSALSSLKIDPAFREPETDRRGVLWIVLLAILLGAGAWFGWRWYAQLAPEVAVTQVRRMDPGGTENPVLAASGYVEARRQATVSAKVTGQVVELFVEEGMHVKADQVLARLDDAEALAQLQNAKAQAAVAQAGIPELEIRFTEARRAFDRAQTLLERDVISQERFDQAQTERDSLGAMLQLQHHQLELANAGVEIAQRHLDNYTIRAPFSGIAISKDAQIGEMISPVSAGGGFTRTGISTIVDMASLEIEVDVNEAFIARVKPGQQVVATLDAYPAWSIPASVRTIIPSADRQKATVKVRIGFDELDSRILPEMGVKVSFLPENPISQTSPDSPLLVLDASAVMTANGSQHVLVCRTDDTLEFRAVKTGKTLGKSVEIIEGLSHGEWVVNSPDAALSAGQTIQPLR